MKKYCISRFNCVKTPVRKVNVGGVVIGDGNIVVQSMTNTKTCDVEASVKQCIQLAEAGCQIVRLTAQSLDAAKALGDISKKFRAAGFSTPLVADIHFLPATAMEAVEHVEKIRVNPGNFTDKQRTGETSDYSESEYTADVEKARAKFVPLVRRCKELGRAIRIGTNHGSLSDRIIRRYGDTPDGMVAAAFEFAKMCIDENFHNFLFSFKSSNTRVMTQAYRLAAAKMAEELGGNYPLHLGVTEAGFGIDARIKSSMGIGGLLFDGLGDTIRVSLTEDPVEEIPVAISLARLAEKVRAQKAVEQKEENIDFYSYSRRACNTVDLGEIRIGAKAVPAAASFGKSDCADFCVENSESVLKNGSKIRVEKFGAGDSEKLAKAAGESAMLAAEIATADLPALADTLRKAENVVLIAPKAADGRHSVGEARMFAATLAELKFSAPIWLKFDKSAAVNPDGGEMPLLGEASIYIGSLLVDGIGDIASVEITGDAQKDAQYCLAILQGARTRRSKAEYIACPSCGRTLYDIQEAFAKIQSATSHLKDITIGVMGCIVNGPGEMADADFGYVGGAAGKINLYKNRECVERNIPQEESIERLVALIKKEGRWSDPK